LDNLICSNGEIYNAWSGNRQCSGAKSSTLGWEIYNAQGQNLKKI